MYASLIGLKESVGLLLQNGANPLLRDTNGHLGTVIVKITYDDFEIKNIFRISVEL